MLGDLYSGCALSLDWLIDSSDEIYRVTVVEDSQSTSNLGANLEAVLKSVHSAAEPHVESKAGRTDANRPTNRAPTGSLPAFDRAPASRWEKAIGDEWLLFVRKYKDGANRIVRGINLTRPREHSWTAAITGEGVPLADKQSILEAVRDRIDQNRRLPTRCDRDVVDRLAFEPQNLEHTPFDLTVVESFLGGFAISIDCNYWDNPEDEQVDEDLWLNEVIVPADPQYQARLLEKLKSTGLGRKCRWTYALVNYPGEETRRYLKGASPHGTAAKNVLFYFQHYMPDDDTANSALVEQLIGRWRLTGQRELIDLTLEPDGTFLANGYRRPTKEGEEPRRLWVGKGSWLLRSTRLTLRRTHVRSRSQWLTTGDRIIFEHKLIRQVSAESVTLEHGPLMQRLTYEAHAVD